MPSSLSNNPTCWCAPPGRVNLIGEHTDYNDGFVLPFAIEYRTTVDLTVRTDHRLRVSSSFDPEPVEVALDDLDDLFPARRDEIVEWARYPLGVAWALLHATSTDPESVPGVDLVFRSDVPVGAGLSSSAAIEEATAVALNDVWGLDQSRVTLAKVGRRAETEAVGAPTGIMDQMASMLGRPDTAIFLDCRSLETQLVPLAVAEAGLAILVIDTRVKHAHSTGGYRERRASCELGASIMGVSALRDVSIDDLPRAQELMDDVTFRRVRHIVTENQRVLDTVRVLREQGVRAIGDLLLSSHASMRDDFEISTPELDTAVDIALTAGALGARMTGGGFGGAAIALIEQDAVEAVSDAVKAAFAASRFAAPLLFTVIPSVGPRRDA